MTSVLEVAMSVILTAHTTCIESGRRYDDAEAVAQVAVNRAKARDVPLWRVFNGGWNAGMPRACSWPLTVEHYGIGARARLGLLSAPVWASDAVAFVTPRRESGLTRSGETVAQRWRRRGWERAGTLLHSFWRRRAIVEGCGGEP